MYDLLKDKNIYIPADEKYFIRLALDIHKLNHHELIYDIPNYYVSKNKTILPIKLNKWSWSSLHLHYHNNGSIIFDKSVNEILFNGNYKFDSVDKFLDHMDNIKLIVKKYNILSKLRFMTFNKLPACFYDNYYGNIQNFRWKIFRVRNDLKIEIFILSKVLNKISNNIYRSGKYKDFLNNCLKKFNKNNYEELDDFLVGKTFDNVDDLCKFFKCHKKYINKHNNKSIPLIPSYKNLVKLPFYEYNLRNTSIILHQLRKKNFFTRINVKKYSKTQVTFNITFKINIKVEKDDNEDKIEIIEKEELIENIVLGFNFKKEVFFLTFFKKKHIFQNINDLIDFLDNEKTLYDHNLEIYVNHIKNHFPKDRSHLFSQYRCLEYHYRLKYFDTHIEYGPLTINHDQSIIINKNNLWVVLKKFKLQGSLSYMTETIKDINYMLKLYNINDLYDLIPKLSNKKFDNYDSFITYLHNLQV